jgi:TatA/E family protein of Tat protein translocase
MPSGGELIFILLIVFLLFGGKGVQDFARTLGKWTRKFQNASREFQRELNLDEFKRDMNDEPPRRTPPVSYRPETPPVPEPDKNPEKGGTPGPSEVQG